MAELAGIRLGKFDAPVDGSDFVVCSNPDDLRRRRDLRLSMMANAIHADRSCSQPADTGEKTSTAPLESEPLMTKADAVRDNATILLENLSALRIAIATISQSHFASHPVLFRQAEARLRELLDIAEKLAEQYDKILDAIHPGSGGTGLLKVDFAKTKQCARNASETMVASLIYQAKRGVLLDLGAAKPLAEMMLANLKGDPA